MSYQVFARKYRPRAFDDVLGQDHVVQTLKNAIAQERLAHAYLFVGPRGTGKTSTARILAKALNCPDGPKADFDPDDEVCLEIAEGRSLDVLEIDGASNNGVEQVRELRENVKFAPTRGKFRIYYIDEVHMLSGAAFNALLKTLEEPPPHAKFIFATTEANKVLPTIISRCQRFDLRRIPDKIIADHLLYIAGEEGVDLDAQAAYAIAKGAEGGMRDAQSMLDQLVAFCGTKITEAEVLDIFGFTAMETVSGLAGAVLDGDTSTALSHLDTQVESGKDLSKLLADLISYFRILLVSRVAPDKNEGQVPPALEETVTAQASIATPDRLIAVIDGLAEADGRMKWNPNKKLHFEIALIKAVQTLEETSISDVVNALAGSAPLPARSAQRSAPPSSRAAAPPAARPTPTPTPTRVSAPASQGSTRSTPQPEATPSQPPAEAPPTETPPPAQDTGGLGLEGEALWQAVVEQFQSKLIGPWVAAGVYCETRGKTLIVGFHPEDEHKRDQLDRASARQKVLDVIAQISGSSLDLKFVVDSEVDRPAPPVAEEDDEEPDATAPAPASPEPPTQSAPQPEAPAASEPPADETPAADSFYDDPLIKEALEIFEAKIKS